MNLRSLSVLHLLPLISLCVVDLQAQIPIPIVLEARAGYAVPFGGGEVQSVVDAQAGPAIAVGGRVEVSRRVGLFAAYQRTRFGCGGCADRDLDDAMNLDGAEGGVHVRAGRYLGGEAWARAGVLLQTVGFSDGGDRMTSSRAIGFTASAGLDIPLSGRFEVVPGIRYLMQPSEFSFSFAPDQTLDVTAVAIDVGIAFRF